MSDTHEELCAWLRANSSGIYRQSAIAANIIEEQAATIARLEAERDAARADSSAVRITRETALALDEVLGVVDLAVRKLPSTPVGDVFACGCMGPPPECRCKKRDRLVAEFRAAMREGQQ